MCSCVILSTYQTDQDKEWLDRKEFKRQETPTLFYWYSEVWLGSPIWTTCARESLVHVVAMTSGKDVPATHDPSLPGRSRPDHEVGQSHVYITVTLLIVYLYQRISRDVPEMLTILSDMNEKVCLVQNGHLFRSIDDALLQVSVVSQHVSRLKQHITKDGFSTENVRSNISSTCSISLKIILKIQSN